MIRRLRGRRVIKMSLMDELQRQYDLSLAQGGPDAPSTIMFQNVLDTLKAELAGQDQPPQRETYLAGMRGNDL